MTTLTTLADIDTDRLMGDTPYFAENFVKIVDKRAKLVPLKPNLGQLALEEVFSEQQKQGKPQRALILKARQVGFSTWMQAKLLQRALYTPHHSALVVAHDLETGGKLYLIGQRMYAHLPSNIQPEIASFGRSRFMHFGTKGSREMMRGEAWPDSTYLVDTAGALESGRGGTYHSLHLSELAFWQDIETKLVALLQAVPDDENTLIGIESTANGHNDFKDMWDDADAGRSDYAPFFWAWHQEPTYTLPFANKAERESFERQIGTGLYGEDELRLQADHEVTPEQLHWRRRAIANKTKSLEKFKQEYPSTPEEAFIASGNRVFDPYIIKGILVKCEITDPRTPDRKSPGPDRGKFTPQSRITREGRSGRLEVPQEPLWVPAQPGEVSWKRWDVSDKGDGVSPTSDKQYVIGVDVSGGEQGDGQPEPSFHAIQVIEHQSRGQIAEYRSHIDPDLLAEVAYMVAIYYRDAWVAVETTGGWGLPVARKMYFDYRYPFMYTRKSLEHQVERTEDRLGWDTNRRTKPIIESGGQELLREDTHGIKSRELCLEMLTYVRDERGRTGPERGRHSDLLLAWLIAQQVAREMPIKPERFSRGPGYKPINPITGY